MNAFSKVLAFALLGIGAAVTSPASPSSAQAARQGLPNATIALPTACCTAAAKQLNSDNTWLVQPPSGPAHQAVVISNPNVGWHAPLTGSKWIGPDANAGKDYNEPSGDYVYTIHFCLCGPPKGVGLDFFPAALSLSSYADNSSKAFLNNHPIGQSTANGFTTVATITNVQPSYFVNGDNEIKYVVHNISGPTGLDVSGVISGYFQPLGPDGHCPH